jgi:hypothetical protein
MRRLARVSNFFATVSDGSYKSKLPPEFTNIKISLAELAALH